MSLRTIAAVALLCAAPLAAPPAIAQGIGQTIFMRGQIVSLDGTQAVLCIGKADGATAAQVLDVYRISQRPGPSKGSPTFTRTKVAQVTIDEVFDEHFARATVTQGTAARHDVVELQRR